MQAMPPIPIFFRSVVCLSVWHLSSVCHIRASLLEQFDKFTFHLAGTFAGSSDTTCWMGFLPLRKKNLGLNSN